MKNFNIKSVRKLSCQINLNRKCHRKFKKKKTAIKKTMRWMKTMKSLLIKKQNSAKIKFLLDNLKSRRQKLSRKQS